MQLAYFEEATPYLGSQILKMIESGRIHGLSKQARHSSEIVEQVMTLGRRPLHVKGAERCVLL